jgi:hypothetical protein
MTGRMKEAYESPIIEILTLPVTGKILTEDDPNLGELGFGDTEFFDTNS